LYSHLLIIQTIKACLCTSVAVNLLAIKAHTAKESVSALCSYCGKCVRSIYEEYRHDSKGRCGNCCVLFTPKTACKAKKRQIRSFVLISTPHILKATCFSAEKSIKQQLVPGIAFVSNFP